MKAELFNSWDEYDFERKEFLKTAYNKLGNVKVDSIYAGGYNIQRLHVRVLVKEI